MEKEIPIKISFSDSIDLYLNEKGELLLGEEIITLEQIEEMYKKNNDLYISIKAYPNVDPEIVKKTVKDLREIGFKKMTYCTSGTTNEPDVDDTRKDMMSSIFEIQNQKTATVEEIEWYNKTIKDVNLRPEGRRIFKQKDISKLEDIFNRMSNEQRTNAEPFPNFPPPPPPAPDVP